MVGQSNEATNRTKASLLVMEYPTMIMLRLRSIFLFTILFLCLIIFQILDYIYYPFMLGDWVVLGAGILIGIGLSLYVNRLWDPVKLRPTKLDTGDPNVGWLRYAHTIAIVGGVTLSAFSRLFLGPTISAMISVGIFGILMTVVLNFLVRLLWYWP